MYNNVVQESRVLDVPLTQMGVMDQQVANTPKTQVKNYLNNNRTFKVFSFLSFMFTRITFTSPNVAKFIWNGTPTPDTLEKYP